MATTCRYNIGRNAAIILNVKSKPILICHVLASLAEIGLFFFFCFFFIILFFYSLIFVF